MLLNIYKLFINSIIFVIRSVIKQAIVYWENRRVKQSVIKINCTNHYNKVSKKHSLTEIVVNNYSITKMAIIK